jgi:cobalt-zinc-cadmium efflux system protein
MEPVHGHAVAAESDRRLLAAALALILGFMLAEVLVGIAAGSLALLADAGHMLTDAGAIALALVAMRLAARPAGGAYTFGLRRAEILSAQVNGLTLALLTVVFAVGAIRRLLHPVDVTGAAVTAVAAIGIAVNLLATVLLAHADRRSLNVAGAFWHVATDLVAFVATLVAGVVILVTGWNRADAVATLFVCALMAVASYRLLRDSGRIFLEAAPRGMDPTTVEAAVRGVEGVNDVHDLHVWEVTSGFPALSAHVLVDPSVDCHERRLAVEDMLEERFGIEHTTLQVDHQGAVLPTSALGQRIHPEQQHPH